jgi:6-phosphogluconolactonase
LEILIFNGGFKMYVALRALLLATLPLIVLSLPASAQQPFAYVANSGAPTNISAYSVDPATGALTAIAGSPFGTGSDINSVVVDPSGRFLYATSEMAGNVLAFSLDQTTGALTAVPGSPFAAGAMPNAATVHSSGRFLYIPNEGSRTISIYNIDQTSGALAQIAGSPFAVAGATALTDTIAFDPSGRFAYVTDNGVPGQIFAYTVNLSTGALTAVSGSPYMVGTSPDAAVVDPSGRFLYVANFGDSTVSAYSISQATGALTAVAGSPFAVGGSPDHVIIDHSGRFLYTANDGNIGPSGVAAMSISAVNGALTAITGSPFVAGLSPSGVQVDRSNRFLFAANENSNNVSVFAIDQTTGALTTAPGSPFPAGMGPVKIASTPLVCTDAFAGAPPLPGAVGTIAGSTVGSTSETGEPNHAGASTPVHSVWCKWTAPASAPVRIDTTGSSFDTTLAVYTGSAVNALSEVASNNNIAATTLQSRVTFNAVSGTTYMIAVAGAAGATGNYVLNWWQAPASPPLLAAILPTTRSVVTGTLATAFATIINAGLTNATACSLSLPPGFPGTFLYQKTNASNVPVGTQNTPVDIAAGASQSFVFGVTPTIDLNAADVGIVFSCTNTVPAASVSGLDTFGLTSSPIATPDMIAVGSTPTNDGVLSVPVSGTNAFATASVDIGAPGDITATVDDNGKGLPVVVTLCRTNPITGVCTTPPTPAASTTSTLATSEIATYTVFVQASAGIPFDPANSRLFLRLKTPDGITRGATSVAVKAP